jgi:phosphoribosylformylglycinamidine cyclo-ligase
VVGSATSGAPAPLTYAAAGVDIDAGEEAVRLIKPIVATTARPEVIGGIGSFGALFALPEGYRSPVLVSSTDGVGTKLTVALEAGRLGTVGVDLVAMCVDDLVCQGAEPLFFLDYQLWGRLDPLAVATVMEGIAQGCRQAGCAIVGGELAEHPGQLRDGEMDLAGFAVGIVEKDRLLVPTSPSRARPGDVLVGLHSDGLRSNGFSLVRAALLARQGRRLTDEAWPGAGHDLAEELLRPSLIYSRVVLDIYRELSLHAVAHITGGGIPGNLPRTLPADVDAVLDEGAWPVPRIFAEVQRAAGVDGDEMYRTFNMGLGMVLALDATDAPAALSMADKAGYGASIVGRVVAGAGRCMISPG